MGRDPKAAALLLDAFAARSPRRYLWTDAFAVCTWIGLGDLRHAGALVHQVHHVLGRHRDDDPRTGWISGLSEEEGARHPTAGGLRIGKPLLDSANEWDRDGQYFHYLTRWMHALDALALATEEPRLNLWARELAQVAYDAFVQGPPGERRMVWKRSIDLTETLVPSMGHHDPLDGLVTCAGLRATARWVDSRAGPMLDDAIGDFAELVRGRQWVTEDPLGLGGLLTDAVRITRLVPLGDVGEALLLDVLDAAWLGLARYAGGRPLDQALGHRLAFRELGLAIGLAGLDFVRHRLDGPDFTRRDELIGRVEMLQSKVAMGRRIVETWRDHAARRTPAYIDHRDINDVMLATALAPEGYLLLQPVLA